MTKPSQALLQECQDLFRDRMLESVRATLDGVAASLQALADKTTDFEARNRYLDAREIAVKHRDVIEAQFQRRLQSEFQNRVEKTSDQGSVAHLSMDDLQLVAEDELNETLTFNDMATKMRRHCDEEMSALDQRAAVLLGKERIEADDNPFGAKAVSEAFKHACQQVDCPMDVRMVFMKSFETLALDGIRSTCREVNDLLVANAILPKIRYSVTRNENNPQKPGEPPAPEQPKAAEPAAQKTARKQDDMFSMLAQMLGGPAGGAAPGMGMGGAPLIQGASLMGSLTSLQRGDASVVGDAAAELAPILAQAGNMQNVLRKLKTTSVGAGMGQMDAMTLEIVTLLFDALFDDPKVSIAMKGLIGRLQLPVLKVAIADKDLFSSREHPARKLLDSLGHLGQRLPRELATDHATFKQLEGHVDNLAHHFQEDVGIFDTTRAAVEAMIALEDAQVAARMQASQRELENVEKLALAKSEVQDELRTCVAAHPEVPPPVFEFLARDWLKYLVVVRARDGKQSEAWKGAMDTTEKLLWSVEPKPTIDDHRALTKSIPPLLKALKAGIAAGGIEAAASSAFFQDLMKCHTTAMRAATQPAPKADDPKAKVVAKPAPVELDFTRPVTLDNPFGGGKVEVSDDDLDFTEHKPDPSVLAVTAPVAAPAKPVRPAQKVRLPSKLVVGSWVTVEDAQSRDPRPARLHYMSPLKSHFLFLDRHGNKVFECSRSMLARRLKLGEVVMLDGEPDASLFDRIMEGVFGKLKKNGAVVMPKAVPA